MSANVPYPLAPSNAIAYCNISCSGGFLNMCSNNFAPGCNLMGVFVVPATATTVVLCANANYGTYNTTSVIGGLTLTRIV